MKKNRLISLLTLPLIAVVIISTVAPVALAAGASLSVGSASVVQGATVDVPIYLNTGGNNIDSVEASLAYPSGKLTCVGIRAGGSFALFGGSGTNTCGGGTAHFVAARTANYSSSENVAIMTFRGDSVGSATVSITSADAQSIGSSVPTGLSGGTVTINAPASTAQPPSYGGGSTSSGSTTSPKTSSSNPSTNTGTSSSGSTPSSPAAAALDKTPPAISNISIGDITEKSATISWTTNEPATSEIEYGLNSSYGFSSAGEGLASDHKVVLSSNLIQKGYLYHFRVKSSDSSANVTFSADQTFQAKGYDISVKVVNKKGKAVKGVKVISSNSSGITNNAGSVSLTNVGQGQQKLLLEYRGGKTEATIEVGQVLGDGSLKPQDFQVQAPEPKTSIVVWIFAILTLGLVLVFARSPIFRRWVSNRLSLFRLGSLKITKPPVSGSDPQAIYSNTPLPGDTYKPVKDMTLEQIEKKFGKNKLP